MGSNYCGVIQVGVLVCFLNKVDAVDDSELLELVEMELRGMTAIKAIVLLALVVISYSVLLQLAFVMQLVHMFSCRVCLIVLKQKGHIIQ